MGNDEKCKFGVDLNPDWWQPHWDYCSGCCRELLDRFRRLNMDLTSKIVYDVPEHQVLLSFNTDEEAMHFHSWVQSGDAFDAWEQAKKDEVI